MFNTITFWGGVFERVVDGKLSVCKVTFEVDPKDYELRTTRSKKREVLTEKDKKRET